MIWRRVAAAAVIIGWFLWPWVDVPAHPGAAAFAAVRGLLLLAVVSQVTVIAIRRARTRAPLVAGAFLIAFLIDAAAALAFATIGRAGLSVPDAPAILLAAAQDAFWCAVGVGLLSVTTPRRAGRATP